jgi:minor structural protein GP20
MRQRLLDDPSFFRTPLFYMRGKPVFQVMGGATDEDPFPTGTDEDTEDPEDEDAPDGGAEGDEGDDTERPKPKPGTKDARIAELAQENAKKRNANKRLTQELEQLKTSLKEFTDKDKSAGDKAIARVTELEELGTKLAEENQKLRIDNAFLKQTEFALKNPALAQKVVDLSEVEIDEDGTVTGLKEALEALKKTDPYLFKDSSSDEDEVPPKTGEAPKPRKTSAEQSREALLKKYPALQR